ncbi:MAG TPA: hypothetical protein VFR35_02100 [Actinoplanes sp.]|nr:hypothetical protein [Actinoplanes sp.]
MSAVSWIFLAGRGRPVRAAGLGPLRRRAAGLAAPLVVLALAVPPVLAAGCGGAAGPGGGATTEPGGGGSSSPTATSAPAVSVVRTGGFAGVNDQVTIAPDGTWTATDRAGGARSGRLSARDRDALTRLAGDPGLAGEATQTRPPTRCADTYAYAVTVGDVRVGYVACPTDPAPPRVAAGIVELVEPAVWS